MPFFIFYKLMDEELANDVFQDTFMKIIVSLKEGRYNDDGKFILWAKRIAHNLIIDHYRLKSKHIKVSETTYENEEFSIFDLLKETEENIEERLITNQIYDDLMKMLVFLPENQQEVIKLRFFDGLSFKEIAEQIKNRKLFVFISCFRNFYVLRFKSIMVYNKIVRNSFCPKNKFTIIIVSSFF
jgi:RNA polymerase sigma-70 factor (ECF subfamily)